MNIPEGYKLVPVEPTNEMVSVIQDRITVTSRGGKIGCKAALREAIESAPAPPQPIYDEAKELERCRAFWNQGHPLVAFGDLWTGWRARAMAGEDE